MDLSAHRVRLAALPTPLVRAERLDRQLGAGPVWLKRDDLTGFGVAGNKARPLEFLLGEAQHEASDVLVAGGASSSNFCAAAALGAHVTGIDCELLFAGPQPADLPLNIALARAAGARLSFDAVVDRAQLDAAVQRRADELRAAGRRPYPLPRGGATAVGAQGYAAAAAEVAEQFDLLGLTGGTVVVATGSGATQAGLAAGFAALGLSWRLVGASVSRSLPEARAVVDRLGRACAELVNPQPVYPGPPEVRDLRGPGFGVPSPRDADSAAVAARSEGLLLDSYYGAKAMTLARDLLAEGCATPLVFWHTGGITAALTALATQASPAVAAAQSVEAGEAHPRHDRVTA